MWIESVRLPVVVGVCNLLWPCSLIETSDRVKWDSMITKGFILEVSSQSLKRRKAENYGDNNQSHARPDEHNELQYQPSFLSLSVDLFTHGSKLSEFIQLDVPSNTLLLIRNEFGAVFELHGRSKIRNIRITFACLRFLYRCSPAALQKHKFYHNFSPQNNGAHVKVIPPLDGSYSNENTLGRQSSPPLF